MLLMDMKRNTYRIGATGAIIIALITLLIIVPRTAFAQRPKPQKTEILGHTMHTLLKPGDIPAIFEPRFISIAQADSLYYPDEPLIVVAVGNTARGYSAWHLDEHEVVNDFLEGTAIAVTW